MTAEAPPESPFILFMAEPMFSEELSRLKTWVHGLLLPVYGREVTTTLPWCPQWWEHLEAVARLHALWLAWQDANAPGAALQSLSAWHRDHLNLTLPVLRDPSGPFAGCKRGSHRLKEVPYTEGVQA
ncbi:DUF4913 domain-containing protein [Catenuloplanes indicus]|uniref:DUF4913 domain-containing protein n=1 Tax=Catenuloplanes indicus TaxID=137267 RepID=A0AAE3VUZ8_9ACTN|nr:DUF4913 domain-containing protein [Catenuloplanes indicus]MDQ0364723.1 hypothetical protein [Catenuloplanes indicus]